MSFACLISLGFGQLSIARNAPGSSDMQYLAVRDHPTAANQPVMGLLIRVTGSCSVDLAFDLAPKDTHLGIPDRLFRLLSDQEAPHRPQGNATLPQGRAVPRRSGWDPGVNVSKKTASFNPTQSHYDSFEYFLDNLTIFWISEVVLRSARCVAVCRRCRKWICSEKERE